MDLESHATPSRATPQQRYAALHRAIERGLVSDAVWKDLAEVSLALGHDGEAARCARNIASDAIRKALESKLERLHAATHKGRPALASAASGPMTTATARQRHRPDPRCHARTGPPSQRTPADRILDEAEQEPGLRSHLVDALQFLMHQHMPLLCLVTMLAFPLVIGLGGFLTSGTSAVALAAISALPGICVVAVICAMGRRILVESSLGVVDAPPFPEMRLLIADAVRFVRDAALIVGGIGAPLVIAYALGLSMVGAVPLVLIGMAIAPMAFCVRQLRDGAAAASPRVLGRAVTAGGMDYLAVAGICWAMLLPLAGVTWYVMGQPFWLQIAAVGPTAVLPAFLAMRLLGTWIDANLESMGPLLGIELQEESVATPNVPASHPKPAPQRPGAARPRAPEPTPKARPRPEPRTGPQSAPRLPDRNAAARRQRIAESYSRAVRAIEGRKPQKPKLTDAPDLSQMPGAITVSRRDRARSGAAVRR